MLAVVLAVSVVLPSVTNSSNVAIADSSTTSYYSGNYYNSIDTSLRGDDFRDKLANLITTTHTDYTSYAGLANAYKTTDAVPNKSGYITWFYTGTEVKFSGFGGKGGQTNREHVWPKDGGSAFSETSECGSDAHHLRPTECNLNSTRGSKSFGEVEQSTQNVVNQNKSASYGDGTADSLCYTSGSFFYPAAGYRGATARILMYVQTRWGNKFNLQFVDGAGHSKTIGDFKTLMKWHLEELPTQEEINRNQAVYVRVTAIRLSTTRNTPLTSTVRQAVTTQTTARRWQTKSTRCLQTTTRTAVRQMSSRPNLRWMSIVAPLKWGKAARLRWAWCLQTATSPSRGKAKIIALQR